MFEIEFHLMPWEQIRPWSNNGKLSLSWFAFSYGYYRMRVGNEFLFDYSETLSQRWQIDDPQGEYHSMVDYQVARLWEDLLDLLPRILVPTPPLLMHLFRLGPDTWRRWASLALAHPDFQDKHRSTDQLIHWIDRHYLTDIHLSPSTNTVFWREGDSMQIQWDNTSAFLDNVPAWSSQSGHFTFPIPEFIDAIGKFDRDFLARMSRRVDELERGWCRPEVDVDLENLRDQQADRSTWFDDAIDEARNGEYVEPYCTPIHELLDHASNLLSAIPTDSLS